MGPGAWYQRGKHNYRDFYSKTPITDGLIFFFATKLVDECPPDIGNHGDVDDGVQHPVEQGEGQSPVEPLGGRYGGAL